MGAQSVGPEDGDKEAKLHYQAVQRTSPKSNFRYVAHGEHVLATAHRLSPRLCHLHLSPLLVFVSPLRSAARPTASTTAITAEVAGVLSAGTG